MTPSTTVSLIWYPPVSLCNQVILCLPCLLNECAPGLVNHCTTTTLATEKLFCQHPLLPKKLNLPQVQPVPRLTVNFLWPGSKRGTGPTHACLSGRRKREWEWMGELLVERPWQEASALSQGHDKPRTCAGEITEEVEEHRGSGEHTW